MIARREDARIPGGLERVSLDEASARGRERALPVAEATPHAVHAAELGDRLVGPAEHARLALAQQLGVEALADELTGDRVHAQGAAARARADHALQARAAEQQ